jgi:hypothetical protein
VIRRLSAGSIVVAATILAACSHPPQTVVGAFEKLGSECSPIAQKGVASSFVCTWRGDTVLVETLTADQWTAYTLRLRTLCGAGGFIPNPMLTDGRSLHITVGSDPPTPIASLARGLHDAGLDLQEVTDCGLANGDLSGA